MLVKYLILCFVLLYSGQLVRSQFAASDEVCRKVCKLWEGDRFAINTICRRRYRRCRQGFYQNYFEDKGPIIFNAFRSLWNSYTAAPCVDVETKKPMEGTKCREVCNPEEEQLEFVLLEVCAEDTYCCQAPETTTTSTTTTTTTTTTEKPPTYFWNDAHDFPQRHFWDDAGVIEAMLPKTPSPPVYVRDLETDETTKRRHKQHLLKDAHNSTKKNFWDDAGILQHILSRTSSPPHG